jgi:hypothetical protein
VLRAMMLPARPKLETELNHSAYQRRQHALAMQRTSVVGVPSAALPPTVESRLRPVAE